MDVSTAAAAALLAWFGNAKAASLELPRGWFGRPFDNQHRLTSAEAWGSRLLVLLDDNLLLVFSGDVDVQVAGPDLSVSGFSQLVFDWHEYGSGRSHADVFTEGKVVFHGPRGT